MFLGQRKQPTCPLFFVSIFPTPSIFDFLHLKELGWRKYIVAWQNFGENFQAQQDFPNFNALFYSMDLS